MADKVTTMRFKVDLQCEECYKKVNKVLCKFPRGIRDQEFDEKQNIVTIKVVCCSPEKMRDRLCWKGCGAIKCIEIVEPPQPQPQPPLYVVRCVLCSDRRDCGPCRPPPPPPPRRPVCCGPCSESFCRPPPCYEGHFYARPVYDSYGDGRPCYVSRCLEQSFNEDNPTGCTIM